MPAAPEEPAPYTDDQEDITEEHSFDELAKGLADGSLSRRRALKVLAGALLGGSFLALLPGAASAEIEGNVGGGGGGSGGRRRRRRRRRRRGGGGGADGGGGGGGVASCTNRCAAQDFCCPGDAATGRVTCCSDGQVCEGRGTANPRCI